MIEQFSVQGTELCNFDIDNGLKIEVSRHLKQGYSGIHFEEGKTTLILLQSTIIAQG
ncbi:hypothetical protein [Flagellimonas zhangzhouensis]|uniref:Uncharacterized protein n=1 Tax=Flagellimonas zhangzhouensis TaxID=1073328 RepID=A0A1H2XW98_9FLAO|nr:hypothetical protein [Allomuricauda zhangzhouensis]SDQ91972.1 hypothetical protein SAMN05216294_2845 [Allomuricauda zhangzhouensis]SDW96714.1 hypothetical protein SAMN04487892_2837 [Allomuricauda zhangzhouensis]